MIIIRIIFIVTIIFCASCAPEQTWPAVLREQSHISKQGKVPVSYNYISGIEHIYILYHPQLNKRAMLLGEWHQEEGRCPRGISTSINVLDFIQRIPKQSDKFIDLFLEASPPSEWDSSSSPFEGLKGWENYKALRSYLIEASEKWKSWYSTPHKSPFKNLRTHWTDLRQEILDSEIKVQGSISALGHNYILGKKLDLSNVFIEFDSNKFFTPKGLVEFSLSFMQKGKIRKQWRNLPEHFLHNFLEQSVALLLRDFPINIWGGLSQAIYIKEKNKVIADFKNPDGAQKILFSLGAAISSLNDAYAMGRFLRGFKEEKNSQLPAQVENGVFFYGAAHTRAMKNYLESIGFYLEQHYESTLDYEGKNFGLCLSVDGMKEPFF